MSDNSPVERAIGNLDARMTMMESRMGRLESSIDARLGRLEAAMDGLHEAVTSARGAWRAVAWISGVAGTIGAAGAAIVHWFTGTGIR